MNKNELAEDIKDQHSSNGQQKKVAKLAVKITEDIEGSIEKQTNVTREVGDSLKLLNGQIKELSQQFENSQKSSDKLGRKLFALNVILTFATVIAAIATFKSAFGAVT